MKISVLLPKTMFNFYRTECRYTQKTMFNFYRTECRIHKKQCLTSIELNADIHKKQCLTSTELNADIHKKNFVCWGYNDITCVGVNVTLYTSVPTLTTRCFSTSGPPKQNQQGPEGVAVIE